MSFLSNPDALYRFVNTQTLERGRQLWRGGKVLAMTLHEDEEDGLRLWALEGQVQGSLKRPYQVTAKLAFQENGALYAFEGDCSCPMEADCKHTVALALRAAEQNAGLAQGQPSAALALPPRHPSPKLPSAQQQVEQWLQRIDAEQGKEYGHKGQAEPGGGLQAQAVFLLRKAASAAQASKDMQSALPELELTWRVSHPLKRGGWSKPQLPGYGMDQRMGEQSLDGQALQLLRALTSSSSYSYYISDWRPVRGPLGLLVLQACARTGRLFLANDKGATASEPLSWGEPLTLDWSWQQLPAQGRQEALWQLCTGLGEQTQLWAGAPVLYIDTATHTCGSVQAEGVQDAQLPLLLAAPPLPASSFTAPSPRLLRQLAPLPWPPGVQAPARWSLGAPVAHLSLQLLAPALHALEGLVAARLGFDYGGLRGWWPGSDACVLADAPDGHPVLLTRDLAAEACAITQLEALGLSHGGLGGFHQPDRSVWLNWAAQDWAPLREAGFQLELESELEGLVQTVPDLHIGMRAAETEAREGEGEQEGHAQDASWFDLSLGIDVGGERMDVLPWLPGWLAQVQATPNGPSLPEWLWCEQENGRWLRLPSAPLLPWLRALLELVGDRPLGDGQLSRLEALRLAASLGEGAVWEGAAQLRAMVGQLSGSGVLPEVPVPDGLQAELRPYQRHGLTWLQFLRVHHLGGVLADDMGLGKTLQTLAHLLREQEDGRMDRPCLVIAPVSLLGNWRSEAARFAPGLRCRVWHGASRHDTGFAEDCDVVIAPYSLLQRDRAHWLGQRWHVVVLDEAQNIKNASTQAAQVVAALDARQRIALSGTPLENHLGELWSLFHFLMPGFLGSAKRFAELFRTPVEKQGDVQALARLRQRVTPFMLRRTKTAVAAELPPLTESVLRVALPAKQADLYETIRLTTEKAVREALSERGLARSQIQVLDALLKLRQVCCDPRLLKTEAAQKCKTSAKLDVLMELLLPLIEEGRRVLLFSQFTSMLTLIEERLQGQGLRWSKLTGQTQKRTEAIERFTSGEVPLFLISLKAGGTGLNLQQADTVIHYDPWWNPAVEAQATGRAHRIGQASAVQVYKLVAEGTIEERILALQARKAALAEGVLTGAAARTQPLFTESDVTQLLEPLEAPR